MDFDYNEIMNMSEAELTEYIMNSPELAGAILLVFAVLIGVLFVAWLFTLYPRYYMVKTSGVGPAWSAFIPIWQDIQMFKIAGFKWWFYLIYLGANVVSAYIPVLDIIVPIAATIFMCVLYWRVSDRFGLGIVGKILTIFLGWFVYWYVALTKKPYTPAMVQTYYPQQNQNWYQNNQAQNQNWYQNQPQQPQQNQDWYRNN